MLAGFLSQLYSWDAVFYLILVADVLSLLLLLRVGIKEFKQLKRPKRNIS